MDTAGLATMSSRPSMPLDPSQISFHVSDRGCSLLLPMTPGESIYGLGLSTELFDLTRGQKRPDWPPRISQTNRLA